MKRKLFIIITILIVTIIAFYFLEEKHKSFFMNGVKKDIIVYEGSDPKGDYIEIQIDKDLSQITHINHTTGGNSYGPYTYTAIPQGPGTGGFSNMYRADVGENNVEYIMFIEYNDTMIVYQQYDASNNPIGNPEYAVISREVPNTDLYETAYNYMMFNAKQPIEYNADLNCGFAAFDMDMYDPNPLVNGKLFGAGYSEKALSDPSATNGICGFTGQFSVDTLQTNPHSGSRYININGGIGMNDKLVMVGTHLDSLILDYGPGIGGGSGLMLKQAASPDWNDNYNGTYFIMVYRYATATSESQINRYKLVFSTDSETGAGHLDVYNFTDNTSTSSPLFNSNLVAFSDLDGAHSPGGIDPLIDQFQTISENSSAISTIINDAHRCYGGFKAEVASTHLYLMFEPGGSYGGLSTVHTDIDTGDKIYEFGIMVKDHDYSNDEIISFPTGSPECILPITNVDPDYAQEQVVSVQAFNEVNDGIMHEGIDFGFVNTSEHSTYTLIDIVAPCDGQIVQLEKTTGVFASGYTVNFYIKYNDDYKILVGLETYCDNTADKNLQNSLIRKGLNEFVSQNELLAQFVISENLISDEGLSTIHWGIYERNSSTGMKEPVCPYRFSTDQAKSELEAIFESTEDDICLPPYIFPEGEPTGLILPLHDVENTDGEYAIYKIHHDHDEYNAYFHPGIDFHYNDWLSLGSNPDYTLYEIYTPCDGEIIDVKKNYRDF